MNTVLRFVSDQAVGIAMALFVLAAYVAVAPAAGTPTETDALQASADISNTLAAQHAAQYATAAIKD